MSFLYRSIFTPILPVWYFTIRWGDVHCRMYLDTQDQMIKFSEVSRYLVLIISYIVCHMPYKYNARYTIITPTLIVIRVIELLRHLMLTLGLYSLNGKTSCRQISWNTQAARLYVTIVGKLWRLTTISGALLPRCLSNCRSIQQVETRISRLRDFMRSCGSTS